MVLTWNNESSGMLVICITTFHDLVALADSKYRRPCTIYLCLASSACSLLNIACLVIIAESIGKDRFPWVAVAAVSPLSTIHCPCSGLTSAAGSDCLSFYAQHATCTNFSYLRTSLCCLHSCGSAWALAVKSPMWSLGCSDSSRAGWPMCCIPADSNPNPAHNTDMLHRCGLQPQTCQQPLCPLGCSKPSLQQQ